MAEFASLHNDATIMADGDMLECPYCNCKFRYLGDPLGDYESVEQECRGCERTFEVTARISVRLYCSPEIQSEEQ